MHKYSTTQLILLGHGSSLNFERSKISADIESAHRKEKDRDGAEEKKFRYDSETKKYMVAEGEPSSGKMTADQYRNWMKMQGIRFTKVDTKEN